MLTEITVVQSQKDLTCPNLIALIDTHHEDAAWNLGADDGLHFGFERSSSHDFCDYFSLHHLETFNRNRADSKSIESGHHQDCNQ